MVPIPPLTTAKTGPHNAAPAPDAKPPGSFDVLMEMPLELAVLHSATADLIGIVIAVAVMRLWARAPGGVPAVAAPAPMRSASSALA